jgi:hypothetical protein
MTNKYDLSREDHWQWLMAQGIFPIYIYMTMYLVVLLGMVLFMLNWLHHRVKSIILISTN